MFPKMKQTALSINVGCGETVITGDLVKALESGSIAGAGLDVVDPEPLPAGRSTVAGSQCHHHPHVADRSPLKMERAWLVMRENPRPYARGEKLLSVVDPQRGTSRTSAGLLKPAPLSVVGAQEHQER
jgi:phosphoglycerate dehydrogenase-like enzyme